MDNFNTTNDFFLSNFTRKPPLEQSVNNLLRLLTVSK